jgi:hypothetical protein
LAEKIQGTTTFLNDNITTVNYFWFAARFFAAPLKTIAAHSSAWMRTIKEAR